jgi:hypothetical protein
MKRKALSDSEDSYVEVETAGFNKTSGKVTDEEDPAPKKVINK